jgi:hypothetical protein
MPVEFYFAIDKTYKYILAKGYNLKEIGLVGGGMAVDKRT